jgi:protein gp37
MAVQILGKPWDTISGCTKISAGCKHCYAERVTERMIANKVAKYKAGFHEVVCHDYALALPSKAGTPTTFFVNSMSDTFHKDVPFDFIQDIFIKMNNRLQHTFQVLTKRTDRMLELAPYINYSDNIWQGVSVERADCLYRIDDLRQTSARIKFIMFEPLLGPLGKINLEGIDWAIVGGESGEGFRPMDINWVREIRDQCVDAGVKFVFKQYAARYPEFLGRVLDGREWNERPLYEFERRHQQRKQVNLAINEDFGF